MVKNKKRFYSALQIEILRLNIGDLLSASGGIEEHLDNDGDYLEIWKIN